MNRLRGEAVPRAAQDSTESGPFLFAVCRVAPSHFPRPRHSVNCGEPSTRTTKMRDEPHTPRSRRGSTGLHLFQELSTLGQQLTGPLLLGSRLDGIEPVFPARTPRPRQTLRSTRSGAGAAVHAAPSICHGCGTDTPCLGGSWPQASYRRDLRQSGVGSASASPRQRNSAFVSSVIRVIVIECRPSYCAQSHDLEP